VLSLGPYPEGGILGASERYSNRVSNESGLRNEKPAPRALEDQTVLLAGDPLTCTCSAQFDSA